MGDERWETGDEREERGNLGGEKEKNEKFIRWRTLIFFPPPFIY